MKILITCPPMLNFIDEFKIFFKEKKINIICPSFAQTLPISELVQILPQCDGWIIGDDIADERILKIGSNGKLKAIVKWGIGIDGIDVDACEKYNIKFTNTPGMFGDTVADIAIAYLLCLSREIVQIDRSVREGNWPKNVGISLFNKTVGVVGYGDIGKNIVNKLKVFGVNVIIYDPILDITKNDSYKRWPECIELCDFLILSCSLTEGNKKMINNNTIHLMKEGVRIINVARGGLIDEQALVENLNTGKIHSAALDVYETEPLPFNSQIRTHPLCILGSHNASNSFEAVMKTSIKSIDKLFNFLNV